MKKGRKILFGFLIVFILIQFIQPVRNQGNQISVTDITNTINVSDTLQVILKGACYDCHSNNTIYPWYSRIQPLASYLAKHIRKGKAELNFNEFGSYSLRRQISKLNGIANSIKDGTMPLSSYRIVHSEARLSKVEKALIIDWALKAKDSMDLNK